MTAADEDRSTAREARDSAAMRAGFEITNCDLKAAERSAAFGSLREMADSGKKQVVMELVPVPAIQKRILVVRERQVMLDEDLAELYGVETGALTRAVRRNRDRSLKTSCSS